MSYSEIINVVFTIISLLIGALTIHFVVFAIVGLFAKKVYPKSDKKLKYGIIIPARNEEKVIGNLIKSIEKNDYPKENLQVFVIAHNCTDNTAKIARELGATVYEHNDDTKRTKGYALQYVIEQIDKDFGIHSFDGYFILDSDNILTENYISKINDAFVYFDCKKTITSCRNSKNFGYNLISSLYGLLFIQNCRLECRGRTYGGCSTRVQGTGFLIPTKSIENGWKYVTLTEDWEFSADQILHGNNIAYCDEAMFYDEQPISVKVMLRQRLRWCRGHWLVFLAKGKELFLSLFKRKKEKENKFSAYDILTCILPLRVITFTLMFIELIMFALCPLFMTTYLEAWRAFGIGLAISLISNYLSLVIPATLTFICERKRIKGVSLGKKIATILLWPIFDFLSLPLTLIAMFKKVEWKAIPHVDTTNFEKLHQMQNDTAPKEKTNEAFDEEEKVPSKTI